MVEVFGHPAGRTKPTGLVGGVIENADIVTAPLGEQQAELECVDVCVAVEISETIGREDVSDEQNPDPGARPVRGTDHLLNGCVA